jgi:hypothetical protein
VGVDAQWGGAPPSSHCVTAVCATLVASSGLSLTIPSFLIVKSAQCNASNFRKPITARSTFGRSGSIQSNTKAAAFFTVGCIDAGDGVKAFGNERNLPWLWAMLPGATHWL